MTCQPTCWASFSKPVYEAADDAASNISSARKRKIQRDVYTVLFPCSRPARYLLFPSHGSNKRCATYTCAACRPKTTKTLLRSAGRQKPHATSEKKREPRLFQQSFSEMRCAHAGGESAAIFLRTVTRTYAATTGSIILAPF